MAKGSVQIVVERCKACGFCVEFCPTHVLALSSAFNAKGHHTPYMAHPEKCSGCDLCGMYCPDFAIFGFKEATPAKQTHPLAKGEKSGAPATGVAADEMKAGPPSSAGFALDGVQEKEEQDAR
jgi:2-oxoglutarate ferredoxin oxidoreductase subunit delta